MSWWNRKIPVQIKPKLKEELDRLFKLNVIASVSLPTECATKPNGNILLSLDYKKKKIK